MMFDRPSSEEEIREKRKELEANKIVEINRLLASDKYNVGQRVVKFKEDFIRDLEEEVKNHKEKLAENPKKSKKKKKINYLPFMKRLDNFCYDIHDSLLNEGNFGNARMKNWVPMVHIAAEKYIFENVYYEFFELIREQNQELDAEFVAKGKNLRKLSTSEILDNLEVKEKFRIRSEEKKGKLYIDAINELEKIDLCQTPRDKLVRKLSFGRF